MTNHSEIINIGELTAYQAGSIVSRTLIDKKAGTVTIFAFAKGQGLSEHSAPFDAMVQIIDGQAEIMIGGEKFLVSSGEMIILPADIGHAVQAHEQFKMILTMIRSEE